MANYSVNILGTGSYVPPKILTNKDLEKLVETSDEWIRTRTGIRERHIVDPEVATSDLALKAGSEALKHAGVKAEEIDMVILSTITPDYSFPATASIVAHRLGCQKAAAFDLEIACSGFVYGLSVASQFIQTGMYKNVLVIGAECNSRIMDFNDRNTCIIFGDGAGAVVVGRGQPGYEIMSQYLRSDGGELHSAIIRETGGCREPLTEENIGQRRHFISMDGKATFKFAIRAMEEASLKALELANLKPKDIDYMVPHQANIRILESAAKRLELPMEKVLVNMDKYGNTVAASIGIVLDEAVKAKKIKKGDTLLLVAFGAGLSWASTILRWGAD
ncbi:beta-ketoacyl-ACP synthase III [Candidatus Riflebacteria bacterium]